MRDPRSILERLAALASGLQQVATLSARNVWSKRPVAGGPGPTVSLTTYGRRERLVFLTLEAIGRGVLVPDELILWMDDRERRRIPASLQRLQKRGLQVRWTEDIGPYKKLLPAARESCDKEAEGPIVTADDDVLYPPRWLAALSASAEAMPEPEVVAFRAHRFKFDKGAVAAYSSWEECASSVASFANLATGVSGVFYPPKFLRALVAAGSEFMEVAPRADDIWFHAVALRNGIRVRQVASSPSYFPPIPLVQRLGSLRASNVDEGGNDRQIKQTYDPREIAFLRAESQTATARRSEQR